MGVGTIKAVKKLWRTARQKGNARVHSVFCWSVIDISDRQSDCFGIASRVKSAGELCLNY